MTRLRSTALVLASWFAAACATVPAAPVPVVGRSDDVSALQGEWVGEYSSSMTGRAGTIVFNLTSVADTARGEVWMMDAGARSHANVYRPELPSTYESVTQRVEVLTIRIVRVEGGYLSGILDPYRDPVSGVVLVTVFRGSLEGDVISGEFATTNQLTGELSTGLWKVKRKGVRAEEERR
jgi:hypothetical protein